MLGLQSGYAGILLGLYRGYAGIILGSYWGNIGRTEKKMETTI